MSLKNDLLKKILYAIKLPSVADMQLSFPNQYDQRLVNLVSVFSKISTLQKDVAEIYCSKEIAFGNRMIGLFDGYTIQLFDSFENICNSPYAIKVIFTEELPETGQIIGGSILVLTDKCKENTERYLNLNSLTPFVLKDRVIEIISNCIDDERKIFDELKGYVGFQPGSDYIKTDIEVSEGYYNRQNLALLESLRINVKRTRASTSFSSDEIIKLVNLINHARTAITENIGPDGLSPPVDYYISDNSSTLNFAANRKSWTEASLRNRGVQDSKKLLSAIKHSDQGRLLNDDTDNTYIMQLEQERQLLDSLIVLCAASNAAPTIKIPLSNNVIFQDVSKLASSDRSGGKKVNAMMTKLQESLGGYLNEWLEYLDSSPSAPVKFISNLPLEWAYHQGLPLLVRHEISRIPVTPGYVTSHLLLNSDQIHLALDDFNEVLVISSFPEDDPIRDHLKVKLEVVQNLQADERLISRLVDDAIARGTIFEDFKTPVDEIRNNIHITWVEVSNKDELVSAINHSPCAVTVFDMHGSHDSEHGGLIHLKTETVSIFDIYKDINISPIVIMSSCDTSPVDKGHDSTAEALFMAGAKTVISSGLPIDSNLASAFLARLLERLQSYLPVRVVKQGPIRWSTLISGMTRRAYYHELVNLLQENLKFDSNIKRSLLFDIGMTIDPLSPSWVQDCQNHITSSLGINAGYLNEFVDKNARFLECMKYLQLGRPELILISANRSY